MEGEHTILFLGTAPADQAQLMLTTELEAIKDELRRSDLRDNFKLLSAWELEIVKLAGLIMRYQPTILHFCGHANEDGELLFQDSDGDSQPASKEAFARIFGVLQGTIRCVVLNTCHSESQAKLIAEHVDVVIGMRDRIDDHSAVAFSTGFYEALGYGKSFATAFNIGKLRLELAGSPSHELPILYARDGVDIEHVSLDLPAQQREPAQVNSHGHPLSEPAPWPVWAIIATIVMVVLMVLSAFYASCSSVP